MLLRDQAILVMILVTLAISAGRISVVASREGDTAFLSANDRSRWATVASLVDYGTFEIDALVQITDPTGKRRPWQTIDRVRHTGADGVMHDYSSKPPLLTVMAAGVYWVAKQVSGLSLVNHPLYMGRIVLALFNLPILLLFLLAMRQVIRRSLISESAKLLAMGFACFGTMLLPMSITLGNHLPAAAATAGVLAIYLNRNLKVTAVERMPAAFWAGLLAAFTVSCELPALLMFVLWAGLFCRQDWASFVGGFLPASGLLAIAFFGTNWLAHQSLIPPYAHRGDGALIAALETSGAPSEEAVQQEVRDRLRQSEELHPINQNSELLFSQRHDAAHWLVETDNGNQRFSLKQLTAGGRWQLHRWDQWYDYPGSYWQTPRRGVDRGEPSRVVYTVHSTIGHHGLFSLTPFWLLVPVGLFYRGNGKRFTGKWWLGWAIALATIGCFVFYMGRPLIDRNYGGVSCCLRWMLWFAPLWIWAALPAVNRLSRSVWGSRLLAFLLLASVFSVFTALPSPWQHPWIYRYADFLGWLSGSAGG